MFIGFHLARISPWLARKVTDIPKGRFRTKNSTESEFGTGSKFGTDAARRCGEGSGMLLFLGE